VNSLGDEILKNGHLMNERLALGMRLGAEAERKHYAPLVLAARAILAAYARASGDEKAKIPTLLSITIEAMKVSLPELRK